MTDDAPGVDLAIRTHPLPLSPTEAKQAMELYQEMCRSLLTADDFQPISGKDFPKRSAMQKLSAAYGVSTKILSDQVDYDDNGEIIRAKIVARATHPDGRYADGDGACSIHEPNFRKGNPKADHNIHATAVTRAKNRAIGDLVAFGAVTAEEADTGTAGTASAVAAAKTPDWAMPMNDIAGVAYNLTRILKAAGIEDTHDRTTEIGNTIFKLCGGEFPFVAARLATLLADAVDKPIDTDAIDARIAEATADDDAETTNDTTTEDTTS